MCAEFKRLGLRDLLIEAGLSCPYPDRVPQCNYRLSIFRRDFLAASCNQCLYWCLGNGGPICCTGLIDIDSQDIALFPHQSDYFKSSLLDSSRPLNACNAPPRRSISSFEYMKWLAQSSFSKYSAVYHSFLATRRFRAMSRGTISQTNTSRRG